LDNDRIYPPLAILYLKSYINKHHPDVQVVIQDDYELEDFEKELEYDLVGISVMTPQRSEAMEVLTRIQKYSPKTKVAIGGPHAKHYFKEVLTESWDYVVSGDGELAFDQIIAGTSPRHSNLSLTPEQYKLLPAPDRTSREAREMLAKYNYELKGRKSTTMMTARGCPFLCEFCEDASVKVRSTPIENIIQQLDEIKELGYSGVYIFDDTFAINVKLCMPIITELKKRDIIFRCNGQARTFSKAGEEFSKALAEHGCVEIAFGFETGSQKILDNIRKMTSVEDNYTSAKYAKKYGIYVKAFILLGLPGEDWDTLKDTEKFIATSECDDIQFAIYYPYLGTAIRAKIDRGDDIDLKFHGEGLGAYGQKGGNTECVISTSALSSEDLLKFRDYLVTTYKPRSHKPKWDAP